MKICSACKVEKDDGDFWVRRRRGRVELQTRCKLCNLADMVEAGELTDQEANEWANMKADQWAMGLS